MKRVIVPLGGMSNVPDINVSRDGDAQLLVNMHHSGGDVVQVTAPRETAIAGIKSIYKHAAADKVLGISEDGKTVYEINLTTGNKTAVSLGEELSVLPLDEVRKRAGEKSIPAQGSNMRYFTEVGFASSYFGTGNGLLKLVGEENTLDVLNFPGAEYQPWKDYTSSIQYVRVEGFTSIGAYALSGCVNLQGVVIDDSVTSIGAYAFQNAGLKKIFIPPTVEAVDDNAFAGCSVEEVYILAPLPNLDRVFPNKPKLYVNYGTAHLFDDYANDGWEVEEMEGVSSFPYEITALNFMGTILCAQHANGVYYAIWRDGAYENLGELPRELGVTYKTEKNDVKVTTKGKYYLAADLEDVNFENMWPYVSAGFFDQALSLIYENGDYVDCALFVLAARLFDGSYLQLSPITLVEEDSPAYTEKFHDDGFNFYVTLESKRNNFWTLSTLSNSYSQAQRKGRVYIRSMKVDIALDNYDFSRWKELIVSIDLFTSGSIMYHTKSKFTGIKNRNVELEEYRAISNNESYVERAFGEIKKAIAEPELYRVRRYDLQGNLLEVVENTSPSNLAVQEQLKNIVLPHTLKEEVCLQYNNRFHSLNINRHLFDGFVQGVPNLVGYITSGTGQVGLVVERVNIGKVSVVTTLSGGKNKSLKVKRDIADFLANTDGEKIYISPYLFYPDSRAQKMEFYIEGGSCITSKGQIVIPRTYKGFTLEINNDGAFYLSTTSLKERQINTTVLIQEQTNVDSGWRAGIDEDTFWAKLAEFGLPELSGIYRLKPNMEGTAWDIAIGNNVVSTEITALADFGIALFDNTGADVTGAYTPLGGDGGAVEIEVRVIGNDIIGDTTRVAQPIILARVGDEDMDYTIPEVDSVEEITDTLYVSEVDNPWHFPNTYKFDDDIVAVASSAEEVSSGQFGQYPLYVFTTEGVWALGIDTSGKGAYVTQTPVSREVCTGQVCPVTGGVVFPTSRGIMIIQGSQVTNLSAVLDGSAEENSLAEQIAALAGIESITPTRFRTYIADCVIAYEYLHNEVIISNPKYEYSYVYSFNSGLWSIINKVYSKKTNSYPELLMYDEEKIYRFVDRTAPKAPILYLTRPIKIDTTNHKRVIEAALRGTWEGKCFFYVLGSNDGVNWAVLGGKEHKETSKHRDLVAYCTRSKSYRYVAFAVASPSFSGRLSMIEMLVSEGMAQNKLV